MANIYKAVQFMLDTAEDNTHGYDQKHRNGPDYDCSSLVGTALHVAGFNVSPYSWTGNLEKQLVACGFVKCCVPWLAGDIHLKTGKHVCMSVTSKEIAQASINEKGKTTDGKTGDQTGKEIWIRSYYEYKGGWDAHYRYVGKNDARADKTYPIDVIARQVIAGKWGTGEARKTLLTNAGYNYTDVQEEVNNLLANKKKKSNDEIAREVIRGKWGTGFNRRTRLTNAGYDYITIQKIVNRVLSQR